MRIRLFDGFDHREKDVPDLAIETGMGIKVIEVIPPLPQKPGELPVPPEMFETRYIFHHSDVMDNTPIFWAVYLTEKEPA